MSPIVYAVVALVAVQRGVELVYAQRNTKALLQRGAIEVGRGHYPLIVALHAAWLVSVAVAAPSPASVDWPWLILFGALQPVRVWIVRSLGPYWTTRIITLRSAPLVRRGPYRLVRHPNYIVVALEIAALPLAFHEYRVAAGFTLANAALLAWRIREENLALGPRKSVEPLAGSAGEA